MNPCCDSDALLQSASREIGGSLARIPALKNGILINDPSGPDPLRSGAAAADSRFAARVCSDALPHIPQVIDWLM